MTRSSTLNHAAVCIIGVIFWNTQFSEAIDDGSFLEFATKYDFLKQPRIVEYLIVGVPEIHQRCDCDLIFL